MSRRLATNFKMASILAVSALALDLGIWMSAPDASAASDMVSARVAMGLTAPIFVAAPPGDNRLFILERAGKIKILNEGVVLAIPFLDISPLPEAGEEGLLGLAFPADYATSGLFYIYFTDANTDQVVWRYHVSSNANVADPASGVLVFKEPHTTFTNHKGGSVAFNRDGFLYLGLGDGGGANDPFDNAQNDASHLGKLLRFDVSGALPATPVIYAKGLRNPFRYSFDRLTGDLWIADVGEGSMEEVDYQPFADTTEHNYGWRTMEGTLCNVVDPPPDLPCNDPGLRLPVATYTHALSRCAIIGSTLYRGLHVPTEYGKYFYGDLCTKEVFVYDRLMNTVAVHPELKTASDGAVLLSIVAIAEGGDGEMYIVDLSGGQIFKIFPFEPSCGLGSEVVLVLPPLLWLKRRVRRSADT